MKIENIGNIDRVRRLKDQHRECNELIATLKAKPTVKSFRIFYDDGTDLLLRGKALELAHGALISSMYKEFDEITRQIEAF